MGDNVSKFSDMKPPQLNVGIFKMTHDHTKADFTAITGLA